MLQTQSCTPKHIQSAGADTLIQFTNGRYAAQGIRKAASMNWKPLIIIASNAASIGATLTPAGLDNSRGVISARWEKDPTDPIFAKDAGVLEFKRFVGDYMPRYNLSDQAGVPGYNNACAIVEILRRCGADLTRETLLKQATSLKDLSLPMLLPGVTLTNSPSDYGAFHAMELIQFDGERFVGVGEVIKL